METMLTICSRCGSLCPCRDGLCLWCRMGNGRGNMANAKVIEMLEEYAGNPDDHNVEAVVDAIEHELTDEARVIAERMTSYWMNVADGAE